MPDLKTAFAEVADALGIGATSIVEKDYYIVELLRVCNHFKRYRKFVTPMVFGTTQVSWEQAYERFHESALVLLANLDDS